MLHRAELGGHGPQGQVAAVSAVAGLGGREDELGGEGEQAVAGRLQLGQGGLDLTYGLDDVVEQLPLLEMCSFLTGSARRLPSR
ncbi:hypothetical protein L2X99_08590 [Microbacterium sp. KUDC0406]|uniref:hypothetical protein n=1 Tax=Microbacterium sp. KUDC0406 TaxID=2909588 RepID=UPI001F368D9F|nr:hypothetical protein [Microbacterium sp. KUDC0406]UJP11529.1 hypothetical protein L2X99_08590 [Microbacterium sp. KUDC0406]